MKQRLPSLALFRYERYPGQLSEVWRKSRFGALSPLLGPKRNAGYDKELLKLKQL